MRRSMTLTEAAALAEMTPAVVVNDRKRGNLPVIENKSDGTVGFAEAIMLVIYGYLRRQVPSSKKTGERARKVASMVGEAVIESLDRGILPEAYMLTAIFPDGDEESIVVRSKEECYKIADRAIDAGVFIQTQSLRNVLEKIIKAFDLPLAMTKTETAEKVPPAIAALPELPADLEVMSLKLDQPLTFLRCSPEGLVAAVDGVAVKFKMGADRWRDLAKRAEAVADVMELASSPAKPRSQRHPSTATHTTTQ